MRAILTEPLVRIVIPACDEAARIGPTLRAFCDHFGERATIAVIANGCTDNTVDVVRELQAAYPQLVLVDIPARIGKGGAIRVGFKNGLEPFIGFTDADGSTAPAEFDRLLDVCRREGLGGVIGSRWSAQSVVSPAQPMSRRIASRCFNYLVRLMFGLAFTDTQCGAKVFARAAVASVLDRLELANFAFDIDLLLKLKRNRWALAERAIAWSDSHGTKVRLVPSAWSMLKAIVRLRLRESFISRLPYLDVLARDSVIPVRQRASVLILAPALETERANAAVRTIAAAARVWRAQGHEVLWHAPARRGRLAAVAFRFKTAWWYATGTPRNYDGLIEIASTLPYLFPALSAKRTFLVAPLAARAGALYRTLYRRAMPVRIGDELPIDVDAWLMQIRGNGFYGASFEFSNGDWTLHFTDMHSGATRRQQL